VRRGGGEVGGTGGVVIRDDAVSEPTPALRARGILENDGNAHITDEKGKTSPGPMFESGEKLRSRTLAQLTLAEDPATEGSP
jgi:hypothetical protein